MSRARRVLVSGAGVAGLTAAAWLGRHGVDTTVVERSASVRADGFVVSLSHASYHYAGRLGLVDELRALETCFESASYHDRHGRTMVELGRAGLFRGVDMVQIMRDDLQGALWRAAEPVAQFRFATVITAIEQRGDGVHVTFDDGSTGHYDLLIGADGLHSNTRALAFPAERVNRRFLGLFSSAYRLDNVLDLQARFENHMERTRYMCVYTARGGGLACVFIWQWGAREAPPAAERPAVLERMYDGAPAPVRRVLAECPRDDTIYQDPLIQIELPSWRHGRVVLLGDAAHCLTLLSGQGASSAFWGASALANHLLEHPPDEACQRYEAELRPVVARLQPMTRGAARWYVPASQPRYWLRNAAMHMLPDALFEAYFRRKYRKA